MSCPVTCRVVLALATASSLGCLCLSFRWCCCVKAATWVLFLGSLVSASRYLLLFLSSSKKDVADWIRVLSFGKSEYPPPLLLCYWSGSSGLSSSLTAAHLNSSDGGMVGWMDENGSADETMHAKWVNYKQQRHGYLLDTRTSVTKREEQDVD